MQRGQNEARRYKGDSHQRGYETAGEILGGTAGPAIAGMLANKFGLSVAMGCAMGFGFICFCVSILTKETLKDKKKTQM